MKFSKKSLITKKPRRMNRILLSKKSRLSLTKNCRNQIRRMNKKRLLSNRNMKLKSAINSQSMKKCSKMLRMDPVLIKFFKIIKLSKIPSTNSLKSRKGEMKKILIENLRLEGHSLRLQRSLKKNKSLQNLRLSLNNELHKIELTKLNLWRILRMLMLKKKLKHLSIN